MIKGIIFDLDGVISDTQTLHAVVDSQLLNRYGVNITPEQITETYAGVPSRDFFIELLDQQTQPYDIDTLLEEKWATMSQLAGGHIEPMTGSLALVNQCFAMKLPLAVASASSVAYVNTVLETLGILQLFTAIIGGDMVTRGKPDPESFLLAAAKIKTPPENCLVIEDGISGMTAAKKGNMVCIGLVKEPSGKYPTQYLVRSLGEITEEYLMQLS